MQHFQKGVNLGGWLSQYRRYDHEHFRTFITQPDIEQVASWGLDHVRLPIDYPVLESDEAPGVYREDGLQYIDNCVAWCKAAGLGVIFDLHHAPGYSFTNTLHPEKMHLNVLFDQPAAQQRFISLWEMLVRRYKDAGIPVIFELLNEMVLPESTPWNNLAHQTVAALRKISGDCLIMIGGNNYNAAGELKNIALLDDPNVCYTFHFYEPILFTHQKAPWFQPAMDYNQSLDYPGEYTGLADFLARFPQHESAFAPQVGRNINRDLVREFLQPALDFVRQSGRALYCGEFGVIDHTNPVSRRNWHSDFLSLLRENNIGWGLWSYKQMNFGLVNAQGQVVDPELIKILM